MSILETKCKTIGDREYTVRMLPVRDSRKVYQRINKYLVLWADDKLKDIGCIMFAGLGNLLSDSDLDFMCEVFGSCTSVSVPSGDGERVISLAVGKDGKSPGQDELFAGQMEDMFAWLDFAVLANFGGLIEKMLGARELIESRKLAAPKA